jgi:hypothetical protein
MISWYFELGGRRGGIRLEEEDDENGMDPTGGGRVVLLDMATREAAAEL